MSVKQVIVVRKDLKMRKGKIAAQVAHASMKSLLDISVKSYRYCRRSLSNASHWEFILNKDTPWERWLNGSFTKVVVSVDSEEELFDAQRLATTKGVQSTLITDSGATEFNGIPTNTCIAIGPDESEKIDDITGHLKLL